MKLNPEQLQNVLDLSCLLDNLSKLENTVKDEEEKKLRKSLMELRSLVISEAYGLLVVEKESEKLAKETKESKEKKKATETVTKAKEPEEKKGSFRRVPQDGSALVISHDDIITDS